MSDRLTNIRASARRRTDFQKQVDDHVTMHILADAILSREFPQTAREWVIGRVEQ